jgi:hypothetical protein
MTRTAPYLLILLSALLIVSIDSCGNNVYDGSPGQEREEGYAGSKSDEESGARAQSRESSDVLEKKEGASDRYAGSETEAQKNLAVKQETDEGKRHVYFGYMKLVVASLQDARNEIARIAGESGGYIESSYEAQVIIRIPKDKFDGVFASLLSLGDVEKKSIETYDVTEYFQDLEMRLSVAEKTRARLYKLLDRTQDVEERLKILREIKRLSEEIENTRLQLETIRRLIAFSSITIDLSQRLAGTSGEDKNAIPFRWIAALDPFYPTIRSLDIDVRLDLGDEFAVFDGMSYFYAESAEGVRVRMGTVPNRPAGDADFWQKALMHYLSKYYKSALPEDLGDSVKAILFTSRDAKPFSCLVGISVRRDKILVIEAFFPDDASIDAKLASVEKSIREMIFK